MENHSPEDDILAHHIPSKAEKEDDDMEEHFPTISLDDNVWMEEPILERHLCICKGAIFMVCLVWVYDG